MLIYFPILFPTFAEKSRCWGKLLTIWLTSQLLWSPPLPSNHLWTIIVKIIKSPETTKRWAPPPPQLWKRMRVVHRTIHMAGLSVMRLKRMRKLKNLAYQRQTRPHHLLPDQWLLRQELRQFDWRKTLPLHRPPLDISSSRRPSLKISSSQASSSVGQHFFTCSKRRKSLSIFASQSSAMAVLQGRPSLMQFSTWKVAATFQRLFQMNHSLW